MSLVLKLTLMALALIVPVGFVFYDAFLSPDAWVYQGHGPTNWKGGGTYHGAPGPIVGAGLPILAIGYGVYWVVKRRRKAS